MFQVVDSLHLENIFWKYDTGRYKEISHRTVSIVRELPMRKFIIFLLFFRPCYNGTGSREVEKHSGFFPLRYV